MRELFHNTVFSDGCCQRIIYIIVPGSGGFRNGNFPPLFLFKIVFVDQDDAALSRSFQISGDKLEYTDETGTTIDLIDRNVDLLTFERPTAQIDLIEINLVLEETMMGRTITVNLSTSAKVRNLTGL